MFFFSFFSFFFLLLLLPATAFFSLVFFYEGLGFQFLVCSCQPIPDLFGPIAAQ